MARSDQDQGEPLATGTAPEPAEQESHATSQTPLSKPSEWELDIQQKPAAPPRPPPRRQAKGPDAPTDIFSNDNKLTPSIDLTAPVEEVLDVFSIDDEDTPGIDLAFAPHAGSGSRAAATADGRPGLRERGVQIALDATA